MFARLRPLFGPFLFVLISGCGLVLDFGPPDRQNDAAVDCVADSDCDDSVQCTRDRCEGGKCAHEARNDYCTLDPALYPCEEPTCLPEHGNTSADGCVVVPNHAVCEKVAGDCGLGLCVGELGAGHNDLGCAVQPTTCADSTTICVTRASGQDLFGDCTPLPTCVADIDCGADLCHGNFTCDTGSGQCVTDGTSPCADPGEACQAVYCAKDATTPGYSCLTRDSAACFGP